MTTLSGPVARAFVLTALVLGPLVAATASAEAGGLGVTPNDLAFGDVVREEGVVRSFTVQNAGEEPANVTLNREGDLGAWLELESLTFTVGAGHDVDVPVILRFPTDAANGFYEGAVVVTIEPAPTTHNGSGVAVALAVRVRVSATLGGVEIVDLRAGGWSAPPIEEATRVHLEANIENHGNVRARPHAVARFFNAEGVEVAAAEETGDDLLPGQAEERTFRFDPGLPPGVYTVNVTLLDRGVPFAETVLPLDVLRQGELQRKGEMGEIRTTDLADAPQHRFPEGVAFRVVAPFHNVGQVDLLATFTGYIHRDGVLEVDLEPPALRVSPGEEVEFVTVVKGLIGVGTLSVRGHVEYGGKVTPDHETRIVIETPPRPSPPEETPRSVPSAALAATLVVLVGSALLFARRGTA